MVSREPFPTQCESIRDTDLKVLLPTMLQWGLGLLQMAAAMVLVR